MDWRAYKQQIFTSYSSGSWQSKARSGECSPSSWFVRSTFSLFRDEWCWTSFHMSIDYLYVFEKKSIQILCPHFLIILFCLFLLLSCMSSLYILDINLLLDMWFANTFSHSVDSFSLYCWFSSLFRSFCLMYTFCLFLYFLLLYLESGPKN